RGPTCRWRRSRRTPASRTRASSPATSSVSSASRRGSSERPQESRRRPQISPRTGERSPLPSLHEPGGAAWSCRRRRDGAAPPSCAGARDKRSQGPGGYSMADRGTNMPGTECGRLLRPNRRAERDESPDSHGQAADETRSWDLGSADRLRSAPETIDHVGAALVADGSAFPPSAARAAGSQPCSPTEIEQAVPVRLPVMPLLCLLILAMAMRWLGRGWGEGAAPLILLFSL